MATQAKGGFGTRFQRDPGTGTFADIAEIMDVTGPEISQEIVDATHMGSADGYAEQIAVGIRAAGDVTFSMNFLLGDSSQADLEADINASALRPFRIILPGGTQRWAFSGYVRSIGASYPMRDKMVRDVVIAITGKPVREAHS